MNFDEIDALNAGENKENASKAHAERLEASSSLAKAYSVTFRTAEGQRVLTDLNQRMVYDNDVELNAPNINYEAAYKNGEAGCIKFILKQIQQAGVL